MSNRKFNQSSVTQLYRTLWEKWRRLPSQERIRKRKTKNQHESPLKFLQGKQIRVGTNARHPGSQTPSGLLPRTSSVSLPFFLSSLFYSAELSRFTRTKVTPRRILNAVVEHARCRLRVCFARRLFSTPLALKAFFFPRLEEHGIIFARRKFYLNTYEDIQRISRTLS